MIEQFQSLEDWKAAAEAAGFSTHLAFMRDDDDEEWIATATAEGGDDVGSYAISYGGSYVECEGGVLADSPEEYNEYHTQTLALMKEDILF